MASKNSFEKGPLEMDPKGQGHSRNQTNDNKKPWHPKIHLRRGPLEMDPKGQGHSRNQTIDNVAQKHF